MSDIKINNDLLKPCPFCGEKVYFSLGQKLGCQLHGDPRQAVKVKCKNRACVANPEIHAGDRYSSGYEEGEKFQESWDKAKLQAVEAWNTRACNNHDALLEALEGLIFDIECLEPVKHTHLEDARKAIKKARGEV